MSNGYHVVADLDQAVYAALSEYLKEHREEAKAMLKSAALHCRSTLKATSPRGDGAKHYADGWSYRDVSSAYTPAYVIYNRTKPGLGHLLNDGHVSANKYGTYGFVPGDRHIDKAAEDAAEYLIQQLKGAGAL